MKLMSSDNNCGLTTEQIAEIDRRLDSFEEDKTHAINWQDFEKKLAIRTQDSTFRQSRA